MERLIHNYGRAVTVVLILLVAVFAINSFSGRDQRAEQSIDFGSAFAFSYCYLGDGNEATSSPVFRLSTTASTTMVCNTRQADIVDLNMLVHASSGPATLLWTYEFSDDKLDWHPEDGNTLTSNVLVTHGATPLLHSWTSSSTETESARPKKNVGIDPVASKFVRISFTTDVDAEIWMQGVLREQIR